MITQARTALDKRHRRIPGKNRIHKSIGITVTYRRQARITRFFRWSGLPTRAGAEERRKSYQTDDRGRALPPSRSAAGGFPTAAAATSRQPAAHPRRQLRQHWRRGFLVGGGHAGEARRRLRNLRHSLPRSHRRFQMKSRCTPALLGDQQAVELRAPHRSDDRFKPHPRHPHRNGPLGFLLLDSRLYPLGKSNSPQNRSLKSASISTPFSPMETRP